MAKTIFEQTGGTYTMQGDYYLPNLTLLRGCGFAGLEGRLRI